jgi:hypothetical protein
MMTDKQYDDLGRCVLFMSGILTGIFFTIIYQIIK